MPSSNRGAKRGAGRLGALPMPVQGWTGEGGDGEAHPKRHKDCASASDVSSDEAMPGIFGESNNGVVVSDDEGDVAATSGSEVSSDEAMPDVSSESNDGDVQSDDEEDAAPERQLTIDGVVVPVDPRARHHQREALQAYAEHHAEPRGKIIMACGTGKTFLGLWLAETKTAVRRAAGES